MNDATNANSGPKNNPGPGNRQPKKKKKRKKVKRVDPSVFWGDTEKLPEPGEVDTSGPDPLAMLQSLGKAPIPGTPADPYFALIYTRAAGLATALGHIVNDVPIETEAPLRTDIERAPADDQAKS